MAVLRPPSRHARHRRSRARISAWLRWLALADLALFAACVIAGAVH